MAKLVIGTNKTVVTPAVVRDKSPERYLSFINFNGGLTHDYNVTSIINLSGITSVNNYVLYQAYKGNNNLTGTIDLSSITSASAQSAFQEAFMGCYNITSVDLSSLTTVSGHSHFRSAFQDCRGLTSVDLSSLTTVSAQYACAAMFQNCYNITSVDLSSLTTIATYGAYGCQYMFYGCRGLTSVDLSSLTEINDNSGCYSMFDGCTGLVSADLSSLTKLANQACRCMFQGCTNLTSCDMSSVKNIDGANATTDMFKNTKIATFSLPLLERIGGYGLSQIFNQCTYLTSVDLSRLYWTSGQQGLATTFGGCTSLQTVNFYSLRSINQNQALYQCFASSGIQTVYFPALRGFGSYTNQFNNMLVGCSNVTVHFPSNLQSVIGSWPSVTGGFGGTNTTVLFDLPATNYLTGANSVEYERSPKDDTVSALAWRKKEYDSNNFVVDWTPFYTSTTSDPVVGNTIYSDAACTTAVTTIDSIA